MGKVKEKRSRTAAFWIERQSVAHVYTSVYEERLTETYSASYFLPAQ